jgi:hypothetical protein
VSGPWGVALDPAAGRIYWVNLGDDTIRGAPLAGGGAVDTLYSGSAQGVSAPRFLALAQAPPPPPPQGGPVGPSAENPLCAKLRRLLAKRKRQRKGAKRAGSKRKLRFIKRNIKDTRKRMRGLSC